MSLFDAFQQRPVALFLYTWNFSLHATSVWSQVTVVHSRKLSAPKNHFLCTYSYEESICGDYFPSHKLGTHSRPEMRFPSQTFLQTSATPPVFCTPTTITASCPANITTVWKTSVQMTAFKPPCDEQATKTLKDSFFFIHSHLINKNSSTRHLWVFFL